MEDKQRKSLLTILGSSLIIAGGTMYLVSKG